MKIFALLFVPSACAAWWTPLKERTTGDIKVPGDSPAEFCNPDRDNDILQIKSISIAPNPPHPGKSLEITASGTLANDVVRGSYAKLVIKYGLIRLISTTADLCEQAESLGLSCPLKKGDIKISTNVTVQSVVPPGNYNVIADLYSDDDEPITCLRASVTFPRPSFAEKKLDM